MKNNLIINKIKSTKNPFFIKDILTIYLKKELFFKNILKNIKELGIKQEKNEKILKVINKLKFNNNIFFDEKGKDIYYKTRSIGCTYCTLGKGTTVVLSYKCHRDCFFCYEETPLSPKNVINPYSEDDLKNIYHKIDESFKDESNKTLAITGGEPLLFIDKVYEILEYVNKNYSGKIKRIYTTGDLLTEKMLINLNKLGLDELRFSIKPFERPNLEIYKLAKKYVKSILIEMPVLPDSFEYMIDILSEINNFGFVDGINLNELTFNNLNVSKFKEKGFLLDTYINNNDLYHRYFDVPKIEIGVFGSKLLALKLIDYFSGINSNFFIHYCDLDTVSYHHYLKKISYAKLLNISYSKITNFGLHKILRIYGDKDKILEVLKLNNISNFSVFLNYIETDIEYTNIFLKYDFLKAIFYKNYDFKYDIDFELI